MVSIEDKLSEMKNVGKVKELNILNEILHICYNHRNTEIFNYFEIYLKKFEELQAFDPVLDIEMKQVFTDSFEITFRFISNCNNVSLFNNYFHLYEEKRKLFIGDDIIARLYQSFGYIFSLQEDFEQAVNFLSKSLELIQKSGNNSIIPGRYTNLGFIYENVGKFEQAESLYLEGLTFAIRSNYENAIKLAYAALGRLALVRSEYHKAIQYFKESLSLFKNNEKNIDRIAIIINIASAYTRIKMFKKSIQYFLEVKQTWLKQANPDLYQAVEINLSSAYIGLKDYGSAELILLNIIKTNKLDGSKEDTASSYNSLGKIYSNTNQIDKAIKQYNRALTIALHIKNEKLLQIIYLNLGFVNKKIEDYDKAIEYYELAKKLAKKQKNKYNMIDILNDLSECYEFLGNYKHSLNLLKESNSMRNKYELDKLKKEKRIQKNKIIDSGQYKHYLFRRNSSLISNELSLQIGATIIGKSEAMKRTIEQAMISSKNDSVSILIRGESGVGKELIAKLIHFAGKKSDQPFIDVNSASFTTELAESTLFGHEKGAFTGANLKHTGYFQAADNGTIFLDEVGDMSLNIQSKLLRVIENKTISPVGSSKKIKVNFRLICATHVNLEEQVEQGHFRFDLLNRINTIAINIPPLRERMEDIPLLVDYFISTISNKLNQKKPKLTGEAINLLCNYDYPGNVRELVNILERLVLFCHNDKIEAKDIVIGESKAEIAVTDNKFGSLNLLQNEKSLIIKALQQAKNVKLKAANLLGISPYALKRRIDKYEI